MLTQADIEAFEAESQPAFVAGKAFVRRRKKGLPADRWATEKTMHLVAECIERQEIIMGMLVEALRNMQAELLQRGDESMGCYDRNGNRTS